MTLSYPVQDATVKLPERVASFYRWLHRWFSETEDVSACTGYFARKQKVSERTIYRWLALLKALGYITTEVDVGVERRIIPEQEPPQPRRKAHKRTSQRDNMEPPTGNTGAQNTKAVSGVCQGSLSGVPSSSGFDAGDTTTRADAVSAVADEPERPADAGEKVSASADDPEVAVLVPSLIEAGVAPYVAAQLVRENGPEVVRQQLEALPFRKVEDRAAALVASVRKSWGLPVGLLRRWEQARKDAEKAQKQAAGAAAARERAQSRQHLETLFLGLSEAERGALIEQARQAVAAELPNVAPLMLGRESRAGAACIQARALQLLAARLGV